MQFEWDDQKNEQNILKHDFDFEDAPEVFSGPILKVLDTRQDYGENRWVGIGFLGTQFVVIAFTRRAQIIRIISMRKATQHERHKFEESFQNQLGSN